jgi:hypothetical protein
VLSSTRSRRVAAALSVLAVGAAGSSGCSSSSRAEQPPLPPAQPVPTATTADATGGSAAPEMESPADAQPQADPKPKAKAKPKAASTAILSPADRASFTRLQASLGGRIGVAVSGLGLGRKVERAGSLNTAIAWSTSKAPVAMAVYAAGLGDTQAANLTAAITASDNAAAERLWSALGGGATAAGKADAQLRAAGDATTQIQSATLRAGFTPFGQTVWPLTDQVRFVAGMACSDPGLRVLDLMGKVVPGQRWGLGSTGMPFELKGGWGPGINPGAGGGYLDRQMGIVSIHGTPLAVTIASLPSDGSHGSGTSTLTAIARWVVTHAGVSHLPRKARCS